jgi:hypothetical protein
MPCRSTGDEACTLAQQEKKERDREREKGVQVLQKRRQTFVEEDLFPWTLCETCNVRGQNKERRKQRYKGTTKNAPQSATGQKKQKATGLGKLSMKNDQYEEQTPGEDGDRKGRRPGGVPANK